MFLYKSDYVINLRTLSNNQFSDAITSSDLDNFLYSFSEVVTPISTNNQYWADNLIANGRKNTLVTVYWRVIFIKNRILNISDVTSLMLRNSPANKIFWFIYWLRLIYLNEVLGVVFVLQEATGWLSESTGAGLLVLVRLCDDKLRLRHL